MDEAAHANLARTLRDSFPEILRAPGEDGTNVTLQKMWDKGEKVIINITIRALLMLIRGFGRNI